MSEHQLSEGNKNPAAGSQTSTQSPRESNVDIIYHNMHAGSDFRTFRAVSKDPVEAVLLQVARHVKDECYKIISISASKDSFVVVMTTDLSREKLAARGFPFPIPEREQASG
ncbi:MAG: hypothetical protein M1812_005764 [Candelaria pacifica]|nr:MAG: hypothetical protein M1812_005764 [Candelaria pacifica]